MKTRKCLIILIGFVPAMVAPRVCAAQDVVWQAISFEVEFGVTAAVGGLTEQSPSVFETGYNGAWIFGSPAYYGMGQTFTVPSSRTLQSIELRVGGMNDQPVSGQFEVAVYIFDTLSNTPGDKLAAVLADAENFYQIDLAKTPVTKFDFSDFDVLLDPAETYALSVTPTSTYAGGALTLQAALDIYPGGNAYSLSIVPEPNLITLVGLGLVLSLGATQKRKFRACHSFPVKVFSCRPETHS